MNNAFNDVSRLTANADRSRALRRAKSSFVGGGITAARPPRQSCRCPRHATPRHIHADEVRSVRSRRFAHKNRLLSSVDQHQAVHVHEHDQLLPFQGFSTMDTSRLCVVKKGSCRWPLTSTASEATRSTVDSVALSPRYFQISPFKFCVTCSVNAGIFLSCASFSGSRACPTRYGPVEAGYKRRVQKFVKQVRKSVTSVLSVMIHEQKPAPG